mgnify:CR=1 FL=1
MTSPPDTPGTHEGAARVAVWKDGRLEIAGPSDWPEGTRFRVLPLPPLPPDAASSHFVVIAGKDGFDYLVRDPGAGSAKGLYPLR